jgi:hypothetical protein
MGWNTAPTLFRSESPTVAFSRLPNGNIKLRSNSIDSEKTVLSGRGLLIANGPQGIEAINPGHRTARVPEWPLRVTGPHSR